MKTKKVFCSKCKTLVTVVGKKVSRRAAESLGDKQCNFRCPICGSIICVPTGRPPVKWTAITEYKYKGKVIPLYSAFRYTARHKPGREARLRYPTPKYWK